MLRSESIVVQEASRPEAPAIDENPLRSDDGAVWDWLLESVGPASMLVAIGARMSGELRRRLAPEDAWQETLLRAWRDRARCEWQGVRAFRRWLLQVAEHRLHNLSDRERTLKRGGGAAIESSAPSTWKDAATSGFRTTCRGNTARVPKHPRRPRGPSCRNVSELDSQPPHWTLTT